MSPEKIEFCPKCKGKLKKYRAVKECVECGNRFFIINTSIYNKVGKDNT
jgi:hypothetical protein